MGLLRRWELLYYPFLLAVYPVSFWYAENAREAFFHHVLVALALVLAATIIITVLLRLLIRESAKVAAIVSSILVLFFTYGLARHILVVKNQVSIGGVPIGEEPYLLRIMLAIGLVVVVALILYRGNLAPLVRLGGMVCLVLVLFNIGQVVSANLGGQENAGIVAEAVDAVPQTGPAGQLPDIYYIMLDSYGRADKLKEGLGYDNSEFIDSLTRKGFYVAKQSRANFHATELSMASSLNLRYPKVTEDVRTLVNQNAAVPLLQSIGYKYVHVSSGWSVTDRDRRADVEYRDSSPLWLLVNDFSFALFHRTMVTPLANAMGFKFEVPYERSHAQRFLDSMRWVREIPDIPGPTFTFSHNYPPHAPFVFDRDGNILPEDSALGTPEVENERYIEQLIYVNRTIDELADYLIDRTAGEAIIILQGDHGPPDSQGEPNTLNASARQKLERLAIFNAYYLPESCRSGLYPTISPVNSFRVVLNSCLGTNFEVLEDKSYWSSGEKWDEPIDFAQLEK